jgi:hypothetical protein
VCMAYETADERKGAQFPVASDQINLDWKGDSGSGENVYRNGLSVERHMH